MSTTASAQKVKQTPHEKRMRTSIDRQVSMLTRSERIKALAEGDIEGREDLSPSQRDRYVADEVAEYQKPEIIRQAIKMVKSNANEARAKREMEGKAYTEVKSKIAGNMKTKKQVRTKSANLNARKQTIKTWAESHPDNINRLIVDMNVSYEELGCLPRRSNISPEKADCFNRKYAELSQAMEQNMELTKSY
jgi:hypothetical protein